MLTEKNTAVDLHDNLTQNIPTSMQDDKVFLIISQNAKVTAFTGEHTATKASVMSIVISVISGQYTRKTYEG